VVRGPQDAALGDDRGDQPGGGHVEGRVARRRGRGHDPPARELLDLFGILPRESSRSEWLSGGEAQRTAIARALINDPPVIIADEPTAHLDTKLSREFMDIVARLKASHKTVIIASHDPLVYESPMIDRVVTMRDGRIEAAGP